MFEIIAGIIGGLMVKHWSALFIFPCIIGLIQTVTLALGNLFRLRKTRFTSAQIAQMRGEGMTDDDIQEAQEGLNLFNRMAPFPDRWIIYPWQFAWSSITALPSCMIVGGIKLLFF